MLLLYKKAGWSNERPQPGKPLLCSFVEAIEYTAAMRGAARWRNRLIHGYFDIDSRREMPHDLALDASAFLVAFEAHEGRQECASHNA